MNQTQRSNYLEALGVPDFLYAEMTHAVAVITPKIKTQCLIIETQGVHSFCQAGDSKVFLFKMLSAIGLKESDFHCINIQANDLSAALEKYNAKAVLLMNSDLKSSSAQHFIAHHPSQILTNELFKREAWEVLKKLQACLK